MHSAETIYSKTKYITTHTLDQRELTVISLFSLSMDLKLVAAAARSAWAFSSAAFFKGKTLKVK